MYFYINPQVNGANLCTANPSMRHYGKKYIQTERIYFRWDYMDINYPPSHLTPLASYFLERSRIKQNLFMSSKEKKERK
jgi:hypothetical protein